MTFIQMCTINLCCDEDQIYFLPCFVSQDFAGEGEETGVATGNRKQTAHMEEKKRGHRE